MKWKKLTIKTVTEAEDIIISDLYDIGLEGAMIEDHVPLSAWEKEQMFVDILPDGPEDDGIAYLSFFVEVPDEVSGEVDSAAGGKSESGEKPELGERNDGRRSKRETWRRPGRRSRQLLFLRKQRTTRGHGSLDKGRRGKA